MRIEIAKILKTSKRAPIKNESDRWHDSHNSVFQDLLEVKKIMPLLTVY